MPRAYAHLRRLIPSVLLWALALLHAAEAKDAEPKWVRINSSHFSVLTDAGEAKGREVVVRFEQMRNVFAQLLMRTRVNMSQPLDIIAFKSDQDYSRFLPMRSGHTSGQAGFFLAGQDRSYAVLDLFEDESWRAVSGDFASMLLNYNYPPTQDWFDEGFAEYFSSLRLNDKQAILGSDPSRNPPHALTDVLSGSVWLPLPELFTMKRASPGTQPGGHGTLFRAQSWIVMHYLINRNKLSETGSYFELVQSQKVPVEQAIQQAYGMTTAQFGQAVKDYFQSIAPALTHEKAAQPGAAGSGDSAHQFLTPAPPGDIGTSALQPSEGEPRSLVAEMAVRMPEHREQALKELDSIVDQPKLDNAIAHRARAWAYMERTEFDQATDELARALELDATDPWVRYYLALVKYRAAQHSGQPFHGLSNMMQDLRVALDWDPDFAEAYNMLAMARLEGGGINSAMESMRAAILLSSRNEAYQLNMARIYLAGKKWEAATALLERLKSSPDPQIARGATRDLEDLPTLKKYGMLPQRPAVAPPAAERARPVAAPKPVPAPAPAAASDESEEEHPKPEPGPDRRPAKFGKGKLMAVDCAQEPAAVLTVAFGARIMKLRAEDYKSLPLIGADQFSCEWKNRPVAVNYKAGGKGDGDLVSLEMQ